MSGIKLQTAVADNVVCLEHQGVFDVGVVDKLPHGRKERFHVFVDTVTDAGRVDADTVPYQELQYQRSWRHAANSRVNRRPSTQFLGPDNDSLTLSGVLLPEVTGGRLSLLALEQMAELGKAWPLIEGSGTIYGMFVIEGLSQTKTEFFASGMPRRIEFTLTLKRVDESLSDMFGNLSDQLSNLQNSATSAIGNIKNTVGGMLQ